MDEQTITQAQSGRDVAVTWDGVLLPDVRRVTLRCRRAGEPVRACGEREADGYAPGCAAYEVEFERLRRPGDLRFDQTGPSVCIVRTPGETITFSGCVWQELTEKAEAGGHTVETARFAAVRRSREVIA